MHIAELILDEKQLVAAGQSNNDTEIFTAG